MSSVLRKIVGSKNERELKHLWPFVEQINGYEPELCKLSDAELQAKTPAFRQQLAQGASLDDLLPEAFAVTREAARRAIGMRHFDVQLVGGIVLHQGKIAEMKTGEGKTLVATLAVYLNVLPGEGAHVVTVNDYLARRDSEWMGAVYRFLGLTVGTIQHQHTDVERQQAYGCDVTYGTNNEFGFDYLRDNMKFEASQFVQRKLHYAIVDEVDSILIDEARTPLIISGPAEESTDKYVKVNRIIPRLRKNTHFAVDEKARTASLTEEGVEAVQSMLHLENLYDPANIEILHHVHQALKAHTLFQRDKDYVVQNGEVIIVDEFTGRLMPGRRYSEGLHQALEAKEGVRIANENQTLATITFQNYFRMYQKLAGMTGTADTEAEEFHKIYNLDVLVIPTNRTLIRTEYSDVIYRTEGEKYHAVVDEIVELHATGRPALVGTVSIENSEKISTLLEKKRVPHHVLNAKHHEREAEIVAQAGQRGAVTIATNMAGRGTDIVLGEGIAAMGGLHIIGTERHEARRIDNQLRGRAGRQGDPGSSRFYLSLEDDLLRIFGSDRLSGLMQRLGMEEGQPIEHKLVTKAIENAQRKVEGRNFDIRKHLLEYDDVMNKQRTVIYDQRRMVLESESLRDEVREMSREVAENLVASYTDAEKYPEEWDFAGLRDALARQVALKVSQDEHWLTIEGLDEKLEIVELEVPVLTGLVLEAVEKRYELRERELTPEVMRRLESLIMLQVIDSQWKDHLQAMDYLKEGIGLRGYAQKDPLNEYKREAYELFMELTERIKTETVQLLFHVQLRREEERAGEDFFARRRAASRQRLLEHRGSLPGTEDEEDGKVQTVRRTQPKVGRNEPCPCGSGLKFKKCCGKAA
ncbi:MAG: preprotein translocase subunit SecA [Candidatus Tectomicrobia bacterium]|nr:preprotein translocase subunit SecA [Candidatus Tectomicrobia bacterium]